MNRARAGRCYHSRRCCSCVVRIDPRDDEEAVVKSRSPVRSEAAADQFPGAQADRFFQIGTSQLTGCTDARKIVSRTRRAV